jgi:hypothetical protein
MVLEASRCAFGMVSGAPDAVVAHLGHSAGRESCSGANIVGRTRQRRRQTIAWPELQPDANLPGHTFTVEAL